MKLTDSREINADIATVWAALLDPAVLKASVPGCTEMAGSAEEGFEATVVQKVGPVKATFKGAVQMSELKERESIIDGFAKKMADQFFENFSDAVGDPEDADGESETDDDAPKKGWFKRMMS